MDITNNQEFEALCARLFPKFNEYLRLRSRNIFACELVNSLDGINSMPALYDKDGVRKQVVAPLSLLTKNVDEKILEATNATTAATAAAERANAAADSVTLTIADLVIERQKIDDTISASETQTAAAKKATDDTLSAKGAIESNEESRQTAERTRQSQEASRISSENARVAAEAKRESDFKASKDAADTAIANSNTQTAACKTATDNANTAIAKANAATANADNATSSANAATSKANTAATNADNATDSARTQAEISKEINDHPQMQGENGNWWKWNFETHEYEDTGIVARGGVMYPKFRHSGNKLYLLDYSSHVAERIVRKGNKLVFRI